MSQLDYSDSIIDRKLTFQIAQKGCGIHSDRYLCFLNFGAETSCPESLRELFHGLAKVHYEADFLVGSTNPTIDFEIDKSVDNIYPLTALSEELVDFLRHKSASTVELSDFSDDKAADIKQFVIDSLKRDDFKRDETTKVSYFKINHSQSLELNKEQESFLRK